jgi:hypothetical protein
VLRCLRSKQVYLTAQVHDRITADTQAVTHAAFLSMGKAWHAMAQFPWEGARYVGGIENVKINLCLRIYSQKWHVYAGLAILNPEARKQIAQYARSSTELYKLMLGRHERELRERVYRARERVFGVGEEGGGGAVRWAADAPLLRDEVLDRFSLGKLPDSPLPNNHLSLLAMVDCWSEIGIVPYDHMICSTPLFRLWLGGLGKRGDMGRRIGRTMMMMMMTMMGWLTTTLSLPWQASRSTSFAAPRCSTRRSAWRCTTTRFAATISSLCLRRAGGPSACASGTLRRGASALSRRSASLGRAWRAPSRWATGCWRRSRRAAAAGRARREGGGCKIS